MSYHTTLPLLSSHHKQAATTCAAMVFCGAVALGTIAGVALAIIGATLGMPTLMNAGIITACIAFSPIGIPLVLLLLLCIPGIAIMSSGTWCMKNKLRKML